MLLICHSLGGIILKKVCDDISSFKRLLIVVQALCELRNQFYQHQAILDALAGIIFLGTPHIELKQNVQTNIVELILRSGSHKPLPRSALDPAGDNMLLENLSREFRHISLMVPVLSACEARPSKVYKNTFARIPRHKDTQVFAIISGTIYCHANVSDRDRF